VICIFIFLGIFITTDNHSFSVTITNLTGSSIISNAFAVSLIYVSYAYSGWNAASYLGDEIENPKKNLPIALIGGTLIVMLLYVGLNFVFLKSTPVDALKNQLEVGFISATNILGPMGGKIMAGVISVLLVSTISSMILAGPRVTHSMGKDIESLSFFASTNGSGIPVNAIISQGIISVILILTSSFESVLTYSGFVLNLFTVFTVFGIFIIRYKKLDSGLDKNNYRTFLYPISPIIFILMNGWILVHLIINKPNESIIGLMTAILGIILYFASSKKGN
jgi:APA family basic amino acid/polyamine antiporter